MVIMWKVVVFARKYVEQSSPCFLLFCERVFFSSLSPISRCSLCSDILDSRWHLNIVVHSDHERCEKNFLVFIANIASTHRVHSHRNSKFVSILAERVIIMRCGIQWTLDKDFGNFNGIKIEKCNVSLFRVSRRRKREKWQMKIRENFRKRVCRKAHSNCFLNVYRSLIWWRRLVWYGVVWNVKWNWISTIFSPKVACLSFYEQFSFRFNLWSVHVLSTIRSQFGVRRMWRRIILFFIEREKSMKIDCCRC